MKKQIREIAEFFLTILVVTHHFLWSLATIKMIKHFNLAGFLISPVLIIDLALFGILGCLFIIRLLEGKNEV